MTTKFCPVSAACMLVISCGADDKSNEAEHARLAPAPMRIVAADEPYAGKSLEQWAIAYTRWSYSWRSEDCLSAESDEDGSHCGLGQDSESPVFFFASCDDSDLRNTVVNRSRCRVPEGRAIMVPISFVTDDDAVSEEKRPASEIEASVAAIKETMGELLLVADGVKIDDLSSYALGPTMLAYDLPSAPNWYTCNGWGEAIGEMEVNPSYLAGYFALFEPPAAGAHEVEYASVQSYYNADYFFHVKAKFMVE